MIGEAVEDRFLIRALVALAKAIFSNLDLVAHLEKGATHGAADEFLMKFCNTAEGCAEIASTYVTGRFLRFRKLHPSLTDEALEHRVAWAVAGGSGAS